MLSYVHPAIRIGNPVCKKIIPSKADCQNQVFPTLQFLLQLRIDPAKMIGGTYGISEKCRTKWCWIRPISDTNEFFLKKKFIFFPGIFFSEVSPYAR